MEIKDIFITPIYLLFFYGLAFWFRPKFTDQNTRKYFIPALTFKFVGAISLGLIYQFYYNGGDTFNYFHDAKIIAESFSDSPLKYLKLMFSDGTFDSETFEYSSRLYWHSAKTEFTVSRITSVFCILTASTYSSVALFFAFFSFLGLWLMYKTFIKIYNNYYKEFAIAIFFMPSVFFWGSGLMKDTIAIGVVGFFFYSFYLLFIEKRSILYTAVFFLLFFLLIRNIRVYILLGFVPPAIIWVFFENVKRVKNRVLRYSVLPFALVIGGFLAAYMAQTLTAGDSRYDLDNIASITKVNADYLYRLSLKQGGSAYSLGELDGTILGTLRLAPAAIYTSLFRPFLWEVRNIVMLLSAFENFLILLFTLLVIFKKGPRLVFATIMKDPSLQFILLFSLIFGFAVGITSYNFGTLVRYKIPLLPFYISSLIVLYHATTERMPDKR